MVKTVAVQGAGASGSNGLGTYSYAYYDNSANTDGANNWEYRTTETLPDSSTNVVYTNYKGQVLLRSFTPNGSSNKWITGFKYNSDFTLLHKYMPSAMSTSSSGATSLFTDSNLSLTYHVRNGEGLIYQFPYHAGGGGGTTPSGFGSGVGLLNGLSDSGPDQRDFYVYYERSFTPSGQTAQKIYLVSEHELFSIHGALGGIATGRNTKWTYTFGSLHFGPDTIKVEKPEIDGTQNGPGGGVRDTTETVLEAYGRPQWVKDGVGAIHYTQYDDATGTPIQKIVDVDTSLISGEPGTWSSSGTHEITEYDIDNLGRVTMTTLPEGQVNYTVYNDTAHETRKYIAWDDTGHTTLGPTELRREDRLYGYTETLTMIEAPSYNGSDEPTGAEDIDQLQTLSRVYQNIGGQAVRSDRYFKLSGVTYSDATYIGTQDTHYYKTTIEFDTRGRTSKTTLPTTTVYETIYDALGRVTSKTVGTTATSQTTTTEYFYDGSVPSSEQVGDGLLTRIVHKPGTGSDRVTFMYYDWRGTPDGAEARRQAQRYRPRPHR